MSIIDMCSKCLYVTFCCICQQNDIETKISLFFLYIIYPNYLFGIFKSSFRLAAIIRSYFFLNPTCNTWVYIHAGSSPFYNRVKDQKWAYKSNMPKLNAL